MKMFFKILIGKLKREYFGAQLVDYIWSSKKSFYWMGHSLVKGLKAARLEDI